MSLLLALALVAGGAVALGLVLASTSAGPFGLLALAVLAPAAIRAAVTRR